LINDGRRAVLILEPDGDVIRRSRWADAVDMLLADEDALGETYFHLADHLGTTRDVVDDQGNLVNHLVFDSFGNILSETSSSADHTRIYAGLIWEVTIDQYRSFTRFYDPATGIWTSEDPIGFAGGDPNLGRYVGNGPTGYVDPSGLIGVYPIGGNSGVQEAMDVITVYENTEHLPWWQRLYVVGGIVPANWTGVRGVSDACSRHDAIDAHRQSGLERGIDGMTGGISLVGTAVGGARIAVPRPGLGGATGPLYRTWNQFQAGTTGQFATRAEAAAAWRVYKPANGIVTGVSRSESASRQFLRSLADDCGTAKWMRPWLQAGRRPPGYEIDHIVPLSIGGKNVPANMRLQGIDLHRLHHRYYHPWTR
jgi:RHS repeat-associated protein